MPKALVPALVLAVLSLGPALAQVPDPVADAKAVAGALGLRDVTFDGVTTGGNAILVRGVRGRVVGTTDGKPESGVPVKVANVRIEGARVEGEDRSFGQVTLDEIDIGTVRVDKAIVGGLLLPGGRGRTRFDVLQGRGVKSTTQDGEVLAMEGFHLASVGWKDGIPLKTTFQARGMGVTAGRTALATAIAPDLPRSADLDLTWEYAPESRQGRLRDGTLWLGKTALLCIAATLDNVGPAEPKAKPEPVTPPERPLEPVPALLASVEGVRLSGLTLRLENTSLVQTVMRARMLIEGGTAEKAASETSRQAELLYPRTLSDPSVRALLLSGLKAFLSDPRSLTVRLAPPEGDNDLSKVGLGLYRGVATAKSLGLTVKANGPDPIARADR